MDIGTQTISLKGGVEGMYEQSFGPLPNETCYQSLDVKSVGEAKYDVDLRGDLNEKFQVGVKALNTSAGGIITNNFGLVPIFFDPQIVDVTRKYTPAVEIMPRVTQKGQVTIPRQIRLILSIKTGDEVTFEMDRDKVVLKKKTTTDRNFEKYVGFLSHLKGKIPEDIIEQLRGNSND